MVSLRDFQINLFNKSLTLCTGLVSMVTGHNLNSGLLARDENIAVISIFLPVLANLTATEVFLVLGSLTQNNKDNFISFGQRGTSVILEMNNTSRCLILIKFLSVSKAQVEPYSE